MNNLILDFYQIQKKFGYLKSVNISREIDNIGCTDYQMVMFLCNFPYYEGDSMMKLKFKGVKDLKLSELDGLVKLLISIKDLSTDQMEGVGYKIKEDENNLFSFFCEKFEYEEGTSRSVKHSVVNGENV